MKLKKYIEKLHELILECPEALNYDIVSASDDEGNNFMLVGNYPAIGHFNPLSNHDETHGEFYEDGDNGEETFANNAVCIN